MAKKKTWEKTLSESWVSNNSNLTEEEAKTKVIECQFEIKNVLDQKDNDQQLSAAKEIVKDLTAGYNSVVKYEKAKIEFLLEKISEHRSK